MATPRILKAALVTGAVAVAGSAQAATYNLDIAGMHAFITFKTSHMGMSTLAGRFNKFDGKFDWDQAAPQNAKVEMTVDVASLDTNHAERDKHLRSEDYFEVDKYPTAKFVSTKCDCDANGGTLTGNLTLKDVTKEVSFPITKINEGETRFKDVRAGFEGYYSFNAKDFNVGARDLPVTLELYLEGIQAK